MTDLSYVDESLSTACAAANPWLLFNVFPCATRIGVISAISLFLSEGYIYRVTHETFFIVRTKKTVATPKSVETAIFGYFQMIYKKEEKKRTPLK